MEYESKKRWMKENTKQFSFKLNYNTDKELIEWIDSLENKQGEIKKALNEYRRDYR